MVKPQFFPLTLHPNIFLVKNKGFVKQNEIMKNTKKVQQGHTIQNTNPTKGDQKHNLQERKFNPTKLNQYYSYKKN